MFVSQHHSYHAGHHLDYIKPIPSGIITSFVFFQPISLIFADEGHIGAIKYKSRDHRRFSLLASGLHCWCQAEGNPNKH